MNHATPFGPWQNPKIKSGTYAASISSADVRINIDPDGGKNYTLRLVLQLDGKESRPFVTQAYLPAKRSLRAEKRLLHLCLAAQVEHKGILLHPDRLVGRRIGLEVHTVHPKDSKVPDGYMDVERFLPCPAPPPPPPPEPPKSELTRSKYRLVMIE